VRGRNSDNTFVKRILQRSPQIALQEGIRRTCEWIRGEIEREKLQHQQQGNERDVTAQYAHSQLLKKDVISDEDAVHSAAPSSGHVQKSPQPQQHHNHHTGNGVCSNSKEKTTQ